MSVYALKSETSLLSEGTFGLKKQLERIGYTNNIFEDEVRVSIYFIYHLNHSALRNNGISSPVPWGGRRNNSWWCRKRSTRDLWFHCGGITIMCWLILWGKLLRRKCRFHCSFRDFLVELCNIGGGFMYVGHYVVSWRWGVLGVKWTPILSIWWSTIQQYQTQQYQGLSLLKQWSTEEVLIPNSSQDSTGLHRYEAIACNRREFLKSEVPMQYLTRKIIVLPKESHIETGLQTLYEMKYEIRSEGEIFGKWSERNKDAQLHKITVLLKASYSKSITPHFPQFQKLSVDSDERKDMLSSTEECWGHVSPLVWEGNDHLNPRSSTCLALVLESLIDRQPRLAHA